MSYLGTDPTGREIGKTFFLGGAGPLGSVVGSVDVPRGLRKGGYRGAIEVFGWQSVFGGTLRDQMDRSRNQGQAERLAQRIKDYLDHYPGRRVNIIGLSAGTGIATWALESLPPEYDVGSVVFLGSSLSRQYDLTTALRHVDGRLFCFYSPKDPVLRFGLRIAGTVDRETFEPNAAGLSGFALPADVDDETRQLYRRRVRNRPYHERYRQYGYYGYHADSTSSEFVAKIIAPLLKAPLDAGYEPEPFDPRSRERSDDDEPG